MVRTPFYIIIMKHSFGKRKKRGLGQHISHLTKKIGVIKNKTQAFMNGIDANKMR